MRIRMPKPEELFRAEKPEREEVREWLSHPATQYLLARLHQKVYRLRDSSSDETLIKEAHKAQGVDSVLEEINSIAKIASETVEDT